MRAVLSMLSMWLVLHGLYRPGWRVFLSTTVRPCRDADVCTALEHCPHLEQLRLRGCALLTSAALAPLAEHGSGSTGTKLRVLDFGGCWQVADLAVLPGSCPNLR